MNRMRTEEFNYFLPKELIAQFPTPERDKSRLLVLYRKTGQIEHRQFFNLIDYLSPGDGLIINDSKVLPCKLVGVNSATGGQVDILLIKQLDNRKWLILAKPAKRTQPGAVLEFGNGLLKAVVLRALEYGEKEVEFHYQGDWKDILNRIGEMPLPPYIKRDKTDPRWREISALDRERYQTVYAQQNGSIAAPTAGLHFSTELLKSISNKGVKIIPITLHISVATFRPIKTDTVESYKLDKEFYTIKPESAEAINQAKSLGKKIIAVGTSVLRALETVADENGAVHPEEGETDLFIYPGYKFKIVDALLTNFHLPKSTNLILVCAFAGRELVLHTYEEAIKQKYRFYSYGDAMLIL